MRDPLGTSYFSNDINQYGLMQLNDEIYQALELQQGR